MGSLQEASLGRQAQDTAASLPSHRSAPAFVLEQDQTKGLSEKALPEHFALEEETSKLRERHPPTQLKQLDGDKLELDELEHDSWNHRVQLRDAIGAMQQAVHSLVAKLEGQQGPTNDNDNNNNNANNNNNNHINNHTNNTNTNNDNNNKSSRESGLKSLDLDNDNPESDPDMDSRSLFSFSPRGGVASSLGSYDQQEAEQSFSNIGETMTIGFSLQSFTQEGMMLGTTWDRSLKPPDPSSSQLRDKTKPTKRVSFDEENLAYNKLRQNTRKQGCTNLCPKNVQLRQLVRKKWPNRSHSYKSSLEEELPEQNSTMTTTKTCWTKLQQEEAEQQQPATTLEKSLEHRRCITNNLGSFSEEDSLGSLEQNASTTNWPDGSQEHNSNNNNNNSLGIGTKNTAAFGILIDTGAALRRGTKGLGFTS